MMLIHLLLMLFAVILYLHGFFPVPNKNQNYSDNQEKNVTSFNTSSNSKYQILVLIIIDALRLDFVAPHYMPFLSNKSTDAGCFIKLTVETPTVTLPRIKALTTGNVPQFLDILLNLASTEVLEDSFLHSARKQSKNIVFYGDDTWLKLFPQLFQRSEGTSSFYVNDFHDVDDNVTRNVDKELNKKDWDIMILHYLGLDHIGHVLGPKSAQIQTKLAEMDEIISKIYSTINERNQNYLIVVTGDHGMKDGGGHGGSTFSETNVPFIILGTSCRNDTFSQTDVPANLAVLLGLEIPTTSIGLIHQNLMKDLTMTEYLNVLRYNNLLLMKKVDDLCPDKFINATNYHEEFLTKNNAISGNEAAKLYEECSRLISRKLLKSSVEQNSISLILAIIVVLYLLSSVFVSSYLTGDFIVLMFLLLYFFLNIGAISSAFITLCIFLLITRNLVFLFKQFTATLTLELKLLIVIALLHPLTFLSSSLIEEEHQFWYFFTATLVLFSLLTYPKKPLILLIILMQIRFVRTINQTGDKWASLPDLSDWLLLDENSIYLQLFFILSLIVVYYYCCVLSQQHKVINLFINTFIILIIYCFRNVSNENILLGRIIWFLIIIHGIIGKNLLSTWIFISALLLKPYNIILIPICIFISENFCNLYKETKVLTIIHLILGNTLFFAQGHSNSLASVDIASGYVGLNYYQPFFVVMQVLIHTYSFPVLCLLLLVRQNNIDKNQMFNLLLFHRLFAICTIFIITFILRHHLFIWTVFAPKLFIESSHSTILVFEISLYYICCYYRKFYNYLIVV